MKVKTQEKSYESIMSEHLEDIILKVNQNVLDFGCGDGKYTLSVARKLKGDGIVFALDENQTKLISLETKSGEMKLNHKIKILKTSGELDLPLEEKSVDLALLYSVACCIFKGKDDKSDMIHLSKELFRVTRKGGRIIIGAGGKTMEKRLDRVIPVISEYFTLEEKETISYQKGDRNMYRFFYYLVRK